MFLLFSLFNLLSGSLVKIMGICNGDGRVKTATKLEPLSCKKGRYDQARKVEASTVILRHLQNSFCPQGNSCTVRTWGGILLPVVAFSSASSNSYAKI